MGKAVYDGMDAEIRQILEDTAREMSAWARMKGVEADEALRQKLVDAGMEYNEADRAAFVAASAPIYEAFAAEVEGGQAMIDKAIALAGGS